MKSEIKKKTAKTRINTKPQLAGVDGAVNAVANNVVETLKNVPKTYRTKANLAEALKKKSKKSGISLKIVLEVFKRGALLWENGQTGDKIQAGFNRLNSYIAGGKARDLDADLTEKINTQQKELSRESKVINKIRGLVLR